MVVVTLELKPLPWGRDPLLALAIICVVWAFLVCSTWAHWGNLTIDSGREVYVPFALLSGQTLYHDVWYPYGPLGPYFNAFLFWVFGVQLETSYWAGALSAFGSATFLFLAGMRIGCMPAGWTAGVLVLVQAFVPSLFCFPFPYSFASVYGCLVSCAFLWVIVPAAEESGILRFIAASWLAALGLLLKLEYGAALYGGLALLAIMRFLISRSFRRSLKDLAMIAASLLLVIVVAYRFIHLQGIEFLLAENFMSWPTSYFMERYGAQWLKRYMNGRQNENNMQFAIMVVNYVVAWTCIRLMWTAVRQRSWGPLLGLTAVWAGNLYLFSLVAAHAFQSHPLYWFALPKFAPLIVIAGTVYAAFRCLNGPANRTMALITLCGTVSVLLCLRLLNGIVAYDYSIFYDGPIVACLVPMLAWFVTPAGPNWHRGFYWSQGVIGCLLLIFVVRFLIPIYKQNGAFVALETRRGIVYTSAGHARGYQEALAFIEKQTRSNQKVMSLPEDTTLFFLSGTTSPTRVFATVPGMLSPGRMTREFLQEIERQDVKFILWSNRTFYEYNTPLFGTDFDREVGDYIREHFELIGHLPEVVASDDWQAGVWRHKAPGGSRGRETQ